MGEVNLHLDLVQDLSLFTERFLVMLFLILLSKGLRSEEHCVPESVAGCEEGWTEKSLPPVCFKSFREQLHATAAKRACNVMGSQILSPHSDQLYNASKDMMNEIEVYFWTAIPFQDSAKTIIASQSAGSTRNCKAAASSTFEMELFDCNEKHYYICAKDLKDIQPYDKWDQIGHILYTTVFDKKDEYEARMDCDWRGEKPVLIEHHKTYFIKNSFAAAFAWMTMVPLKLIKNPKDSIWYWTAGQPALKMHWVGGPNSRSVTLSSHGCSFMDKKGDWYAETCSKKTEFFICQKESTRGPSEIKMSINWDRFPNYFYEETWFQANCSVFNPSSNITWVSHGKPPGVESEKLVRNVTYTRGTDFMKDGRCGTIITSSLSFRVELHHTGVFFSCFGYNNLFPRFMQCPKGQVFSYCDMSRKLKVLEKPRDVKLHRVHFHAPPSTLYTGEKISLTCSAYRPKHKTLTWKLHSSRLSLHQLNITKTDFMNGSRTVSSISFEIQKLQDGMVLYCLDISPNVTSKICTANEKLWTYCDFTPAIRVIDDGPRGPPEFILEYEGFPDPLAPNTMASASCAVTHGGSGTLIWVAYFNSGPKAFFFNETERNPVVSFSELPDNSSDTNDTVVRSAIEFAMKPSLSGLRIACFAFDIRDLRPFTLECLEGEYCAISHTLIVEPSWVWILNAFWLFLPLIVLMLIALICIPLALFRSPSNMSEAYHEDDDYTTGISDNKTYLETSPALQLLTQQSFIDAFLGPNADVDGAMEAKKMGRKLKPGTSSSVDDFHALSDGSMYYEVMKPKGNVINLQDRLARQKKQLAKRKKAVSGTVTSIGQSGTTGSQRSTFQS